MPPNKPAAPKQVTITFKDGHGKGQAGIAYAALGDKLGLLTCGGDGVVSVRDKGERLEAKHSYNAADGAAQGSADEGGVNVLAVDYAAPSVAIGSQQQIKVQMQMPPDKGAVCTNHSNARRVMADLPRPVISYLLIIQIHHLA